ncbi:MAG: Gfo/Idh/MocA family oxidoreductase [Candidatus Brocadiae bacterium]|nr:Gfo/Idh/MocA family oxidoreductase [Candidatus Brocadiia bacterium]
MSEAQAEGEGQRMLGVGMLGYGFIRDLGAHVVDLLWWLIGPFESVSCTRRIWSAERPNKDSPGRMLKVDVEEAAAIVLRRHDGAFGTVEVSRIATGTQDELRFEIHGPHGALRWNLMQPNYLEVYDERLADGDYGGRRGWQRIQSVQRYPGAVFPGPKFSIGWVRAHVECLHAFLKAIARGTPARPSLADGLHLQRVLETVRAAAASGQWEDLPQPRQPGQSRQPGNGR